MKFNPWTVALLGAGIVSVPAITQAEEKPNFVQTALASTTLSGYVDTSVQWNFGTGNENLPPYAFGGPGKADGYTMEPTTHTGLLATYQVCDLISVNAGIANTFGPRINERGSPPFNTQAESWKTYMASVTLTAPTNSGFLAGSTLSACIINGF